MNWKLITAVVALFAVVLACEDKRCNEEETEYNKHFVDVKCGKTLQDPKKFAACYEEAGFFRNATLDSLHYCGNVCTIKDKTTAYVSQCCFLKRFLEAVNKTLDEKKETEQRCILLSGNYTDSP